MASEIAEPDVADDRSVGIVQTQYAELFQPPAPLVLESGERLGPIRVAYETYGELSPRADNAIFVCHALTGDAHVAGRHSLESKSGWWDSLVGPGKTLDTDRYFVICANVLGGCQGTTGPTRRSCDGQALRTPLPVPDGRGHCRGPSGAGEESGD